MKVEDAEMGDIVRCTTDKLVGFKKGGEYIVSSTMLRDKSIWKYMEKLTKEKK